MANTNDPRQRATSVLPIRPQFNALVQDYTERVYNHAYRMLGNREDSEEATMDVFLKIHHGLADFRGDAQLSTWIWRITTNVCLSRRAQKREKTVSIEVDKVEEVIADLDTASNPVDVFLKEEVREELARSIAKLPEQEAAAITLFYLEGMKYEEIATILGVPMGTVATALHRAWERLRKKMYAERVRT
ncbi:MAG: sigma-70 family RNA polymerase sigma factor [Ignavibacteriales bacterium]|nr:sigma-70 family RNA polymerase sigma factor [Ignavibacteriales bacterium]